MPIPNVNIDLVPGMGRREASIDSTTGMIFPYESGNPQNVLKLTIGSYKSILVDNNITNPAVIAAITDFFTYSPNAYLYISFEATSYYIDFVMVNKLMTASNGDINQIGIDKGWSISLSELQSIAETFKTLHTPILIVINAYNIYTGGGIRTNLMPNICYLVEDCLGIALGCISSAKVNHNVGWVDRFPIDITGMTLCQVDDGTDIETFHDYGYMFLRKLPGKTDGYWNTFPTCDALSSDYAYGENVRTINKAHREVYKALVGYLNSPVLLQKDGTIHPSFIGDMTSKVSKALGQMATDGEISNYSVYIDPAQKLIEQGENINVEIKVQPFGTARMINVKLSLSAQIA